MHPRELGGLETHDHGTPHACDCGCAGYRLVEKHAMLGRPFV